MAEFAIRKPRKGSMRAALNKTKKGTPAEKRAVAEGKKAAARALELGKSKKEADALGKKITMRQMKTDRGTRKSARGKFRGDFFSRKGSMRTTLDKTNKGTPAEKRAVDKGLKAAAKAQKEGKSKKEADAIGKKITTSQMKTDRSKTNVEALWTAATILPLGIGQAGRIARTGYKTAQAVKKLSQDTIKKEVAKKAANAARRKAADAAKKLKETRGYLSQSEKAKKAAKLAAATAAKKKAADAARRKAAAEAAKQQKLVTAANKKGRRKYTNFVERGANSGQGLRVAAPIAVTASRAASENKPDAAKKPVIVKKPDAAKKPVIVKKPKDTLQDFIDEPTTASDNYKTSKKSKPKKLKTVDGDMLGGYGTPKDFPDKISINPITGERMITEYSYPSSDDPDNNRKMGGKVRRRMGGKVRGYGKAQRGY